MVQVKTGLKLEDIEKALHDSFCAGRLMDASVIEHWFNLVGLAMVKHEHPVDESLLGQLFCTALKSLGINHTEMKDTTISKSLNEMVFGTQWLIARALYYGYEYGRQQAEVERAKETIH